jgi:hypothetical protein
MSGLELRGLSFLLPALLDRLDVVRLGFKIKRLTPLRGERFAERLSLEMRQSRFRLG